MHPEGKARGIGIVRGLTPGQDLPQDGTAICEMFGVTIHTQGRGKITRGSYPVMKY